MRYLKAGMIPSRCAQHTREITIGLTGARGELGGILRRSLTERGFNVIGIERKALKVVPSGRRDALGEDEIDDVSECRTADFEGHMGHAAVRGVFEGCDAVVHLAALPKPWESYENVLRVNMTGDELFYKEAVRAGCRRFVYASTNHVQHGATTRTTPETLDSTRFGAHLPDYQLKTIHDSPAPDSFYAVSKLNGENLGRLYARDHGLEVVAVRIGWSVPETDPRDSRWLETPDHHEFMRCMYLGAQDCSEIFTRAVTNPLDAEEVQQLGRKGGRYAAVYAVSNNRRRVFDLSCTAAVLGYSPSEDAETFYG